MKKIAIFWSLLKWLLKTAILLFIKLNEKADTMSHYKTLGVNKKASVDEIKKAYRALAKKYHPDQNDGDEKAEAKFKDVAVAYETLSDPDKRNHYDRFGSDPQGGQRRPSGFSGFGVQKRSLAKRNIPPDIKTPINLTLSEAIFGCSKVEEVSRIITCKHCKGYGGKEESDDCSSCDGQGSVYFEMGANAYVSQTCPSCRGIGKKVTRCTHCDAHGCSVKHEKIKVTVPPNVSQRLGLRVKGKGNVIYAGKDQEYTGNLIFEVNYRTEENNVRRKANDLYTFVAVPFDQILAEDEIEVLLFKNKTVKLTLESDKGIAHKYVIDNPFIKGGTVNIEVFPSLPTNKIDSERRLHLVQLIRELYGESPKIIPTSIRKS